MQSHGLLSLLPHLILPTLPTCSLRSLWVLRISFRVRCIMNAFPHLLTYSVLFLSTATCCLLTPTWVTFLPAFSLRSLGMGGRGPARGGDGYALPQHTPSPLLLIAQRRDQQAKNVRGPHTLHASHTYSHLSPHLTPPLSAHLPSPLPLCHPSCLPLHTPLHPHVIFSLSVWVLSLVLLTCKHIGVFLVEHKSMVLSPVASHHLLPFHYLSKSACCILHHCTLSSACHMRLTTLPCCISLPSKHNFFPISHPSCIHVS